jgi:hypothetical protein
MDNEQVKKAKETLEAAGYYVGNLWQTKDVMQNYKCEDEDDAYSILDEVMTSEQTAQNIFEQISLIVEKIS